MQEMLQLQSSADSTLAMAVLAAQICLTLSITTTDCDCAISTVRRVKSRLRSEMKAVQLNDCMRVSIDGSDTELYDFDLQVC